MRRNRKRLLRKGATLIELLVVASIMLTLAAISVPAIKPMMESQTTLRAATTVSTYLERARSRAITTGRPCGVLFECFPGTYDDSAELPGSACLVMRQVEVPPSNSGLTFNATISVCNYTYDASGSFVALPTRYNGKRVSWLSGLYDPNVSFANGRFYGGTVDPAWSAFWNAYIRASEAELNIQGSSATDKAAVSIQFNSIGPFYPLRRVDLNANCLFCVEEIPGIELPDVGVSSATFKYEALNEPRATMTAPIGLPQGAIVDLEYSGTDNTRFALGKDITIMFAPNGEVDYILNGDEKAIPGDTIYLLIGRWDRIPALGFEQTTEYGSDYFNSSADDGLLNFEDDSNYWVSINPLSGLTSTTPLDQPFTYSDYRNQSNYSATLYDEGAVPSRGLARNSKRNLGGR